MHPYIPAWIACTLMRAQDNKARVKAWLQRPVLWLIGKAPKVVLSVPTDEFTPTLMAAQLSTLPPTISLASPYDEPCAILTCSMTVNVMETLHALPQWIKHLELSWCQWPLRPEAYKQLALHVPLGVKECRLSVPANSPLASAISEGIAARRDSLSRLPLAPLELVCPDGHFSL
jgi:hypothetical protein